MSDQLKRCWFELKDVDSNQSVRMPIRHDQDEARVAVGDLDYTLGNALYHALFTHPLTDTVGNDPSDQERHVVFPVLTNNGTPAVKIIRECAQDLVHLFACLEQRMDVSLDSKQTKTTRTE